MNSFRIILSLFVVFIFVQTISGQQINFNQRSTDRQDLNNLEIDQYLDEEFIEEQAENITNLAGLVADLRKFITDNNGGDLALALYIFDEYLQRTG